MQVSAFNIFRYEIPLTEPLLLEGRHHRSRSGLIVRVTGEGGWWAFPGEAHEHLDAQAPDYVVRVADTGEEYAVEQIPIGVRTVEPVPHLPAGTCQGWMFEPPESTYTIQLCSPDGKVLITVRVGGEVVRDGRDWSDLVLETMGGKAWGDVLRHRPDDATDDLPEAARMGLEHGKWQPAMILRLLRPEGGGQARPREAWAGLVCPYCLCMAYLWPGPWYGRCR